MKNQKIEKFRSVPLQNASFVKPVRLNYRVNGKSKSWEAVKSHDSVAVLLFHKTKKAFLLVKQFRAPVYMNYKEHEFTYELCAGIIDKDKSLEEIAQEEIQEECGYRVPLDQIEKISSFFTNVGISGGKQHLFFAFIDDNLKVGEGGGINDEYIELEYLSLEDSKEFVYNETKAKTPGLMFSFYWFYEKYKLN